MSIDEELFRPNRRYRMISCCSCNSFTSRLRPVLGSWLSNADENCKRYPYPCPRRPSWGTLTSNRPRGTAPQSQQPMSHGHHQWLAKSQWNCIVQRLLPHFVAILYIHNDQHFPTITKMTKIDQNDQIWTIDQNWPKWPKLVKITKIDQITTITKLTKINQNYQNWSKLQKLQYWPKLTKMTKLNQLTKSDQN